MSLIKKQQNTGFTLVETTIVVIVFGLMIAGAMNYMTTFELKSRNTSVKQRLGTLKVAIEGYIEQFGALPCPASLVAEPGSAAFSAPTDCSDKSVPIGQCSLNGEYCVQGGPMIEQPDSKIKRQARVRIGGIPARAINVPYEMVHDTWNNRIIYAVAENLAEDKGAFYNGQGAIGIIDESGSSFITPPSSATYVVLSHGLDAAGARTLGSGIVSRPCNGQNTKDGENCDFLLGVQDAVFRVGFFSNTDTAGRYDDLMVYDTKRSSYQQASAPSCKDMPPCTEDNASSVPICRVSGGSDGLPLCTTREDVKAGIESSDEYAHDITTWKHACDFGDGWRLPSLGELRALYEHQDEIGGFQGGNFYLSRSYFNPGLIENDDRKLEVWAKKFSSGAFQGSKEKTLNLSPVRSDKGESGYIRCIMR